MIHIEKKVERVATYARVQTNAGPLTNTSPVIVKKYVVYSKWKLCPCEFMRYFVLLDFVGLSELSYCSQGPLI